MPRNELRTSGLLQAAIAALVVGWVFKDTPATAEPRAWPYVVAVYALLASIAPWLAGGIGRGELRWQYSLLLGAFFAAPMALAAGWLAGSPYPALRLGAWCLVAAWGVHLLVAVALALSSRRG